MSKIQLDYLLKIMYLKTTYNPRAALMTKPHNPITEMSHIFGPLSAKIANDEPMINADTIKEAES